MWTAIGLGLLKVIPAIVGLVEKTSNDNEENTGDKLAGTSKLDLAVNMAILVLNSTKPGSGANARQRAAIIGAINANVELANAFKEDR
jgi:hypothetical protein